MERNNAPQPPPRPLEVLTHYEILDVDLGAPEEEIRRGYKRIRELYSAGRLAGYGLVDDAAAATMRGRIEAARDILLDPKSRRTYDLALPRLANLVHDEDVEIVVEVEQEELSSGPAGTDDQEAAAPRGQPAPPPEPKVVLHPDTEYTGAILRQVREAQGVELREITARTKIGMSYLKAIELEDFANLPALVYTRGFVGEIAKYLELDHQQVTKTYIKRFQKYLEETGKLD